MRKITIGMAFLIGGASLFSSCQKDGTTIIPDNIPVNFDAAYIVNGESNSISVVNLSTNKVDRTMVLPQLQNSQGTGMMGSGTSNMWPHHISLSPDKSKLAIAFPGSDFSGGSGMMLSSYTAGSMMGNISANLKTQGKILVLDAVTGGLLKELTLEGVAFNAIFSPDGKELWTAVMLPEGKVKVFDASTYALLNTITVGQMPAEVSFSDDRKRVFVANGMSNTVTVIDAVSKQVLDNMAVGDYPVGAWPGMGGMMYVDNEKGQSISVVNSMTDMMTDQVQLGFIPGMVTSSAMLNQMWVTDPNTGKIHIWTKNSSGYVPGETVTVGSGASAMAFNKDETTCYVTNQNEGTISVVDVINHKETMKITVGQKPNGIVIRYK